MEINMNKVFLGAAVLLSVASTQVMAGPNWNQASASYLSADIGDNDDIDGLGLSGTKLLNSNFFLAGSYSSLTLETFNAFGYEVDADLNFLSLGVGARKAVAGNTDIYGIVSYEKIDLSVSTGFGGFYSAAVDDESGYGLRIGVRSMMTPKVEVNGEISYIDVLDDAETGFGFGAAYYFTNQFSAGAGYNTSDDIDTLNLTATFNF
jgi:hypothetical protein